MQFTNPSIAEALVLIDSHTHILPDEFRSDRDRIARADATFGALFASAEAKTASAEDLIASMDAAGVVASVAAGYGWTDIGVARLANDYALASAKKYPKRIIPFCSVNPLWGQSAAQEVRRCAEVGARGIGELHADTQGFASGDPAVLKRLAPVMKAARSFGLPVLVHASEPVGHVYPGKGTFTPDRLVALPSAYPDNAFIFAHFGGGLPFYAHMPEVAKLLRNVYFDSAAQPFLYDQRVYRSALTALGSRRVLFGSDFPLVSQTRALAAARTAGLAQAELNATLGATANALFTL